MTRTLLVIMASQRETARRNARLAALVGDFPRRASASGTEPATSAVACMPLGEADRAEWEQAKRCVLSPKAIDYDDTQETPAAALLRGAGLRLIAPAIAPAGLGV